MLSSGFISDLFCTMDRGLCCAEVRASRFETTPITFTPCQSVAWTWRAYAVGVFFLTFDPGLSFDADR